MRMKFCFYAAMTFLLLTLAASAQTTSFLYQGQLNDGTNPATGFSNH
jgi:hypothetical protein